MKELSLNILDIAENSVKAGASRIEISVTEKGNSRELVIKDDGCGMSKEMVETVTDPFMTSRTTRPVGMGIPLLKLAAEQTGGHLEISSSQGADHGTRVCAQFFTDHIDCVPLGDLASTMVTLLQGNPNLDFSLVYETEEGRKDLDTGEMREILGEDVPLDSPPVLMWVAELIREPFNSEETTE